MKRNTRLSKHDDFYRTQTHGGRPSGFFLDHMRLIDKPLILLAQHSFGANSCRIALLCSFGESPVGWGDDLYAHGFMTERMVANPDQNKKSPPYDGIRHVVGVSTLSEALWFGGSETSGICAVRFLRDQPDPALATALRRLPSVPLGEPLI